MRFSTSILIVGVLITAASWTTRAQDSSYKKAAEIPIGGAARFDYLTMDSAEKRLYVTHGTEIVVIDTQNNTVVGKIADTPGVHGIAIAPGGRGFVTNGTENTVSIVDLKTLKTLSKVETGRNPDAILYEPKQKEVYAWNHTGNSATVIDPAKGTVIATIPLSGTAETGQSDPGLGRVFVNIEDTSMIDVIDAATHKVVATWPIAPVTTPTGMALDAPSHRLFVGGGKFMGMIDTSSGKVVASAPICTGTDATWFDPGTKMVFASCSDGNITAMRVQGDSLAVVQTIATTRGARTMTIDPATHRLYTAGAKYPPADPGAAPAAGGRGPAALPESFHVLVFSMGGV